MPCWDYLRHHFSLLNGWNWYHGQQTCRVHLCQSIQKLLVKLPKQFLRQIWQLENTCKTKCILNNNVWFSVNFPYQRVIPHSPSYSLNTIDCVYVNLFIASNVISAHISWSWGGAAAVDDNLMVAVNALSFSWTNHVALLWYAL